MEVLADTGIIPLTLLSLAVQHLTELHQRYPTNGLILFDMTMARSGAWSGKPIAATPDFVAALKQAISLDPHLPKAYVALAAVYEEEKDYRQEIAELQHAIALAPEQAQTHYRLAFAYRKAGDQEHFREQIERYQALHAKQLTAK
jgi:tetratricopeptide (TPR) repeat protein